MSAIDRLQQLKDQNRITGIDFVHVHEGQRVLDIYFLHPPRDLEPEFTGPIDPKNIVIENMEGAQVPVINSDWVTIASEDMEDREVLRIETAYPGGYTLFNLYIESDRIDPYYNNITFTFRPHCPEGLDCKPPEHECPPEEMVDFPVDYQARDFHSFRQALLDFAAQRYPNWPDRLEADAGVMLVEAMSALGDEMAYFQDRVSREAYLETASQRRSLRHHARLVDYPIHEGLGASTWLNIQVKLGYGNQTIAAGTNVWASDDKGLRTYFEVGRGLKDIFDPESGEYDPELYVVSDQLNSLYPHIWDEDDTCLSVGTTEMYIKDWNEEILTFNDIPDNKNPGRWILLQTSPSDPVIRRVHLVRLVKVTNSRDPLLEDDEESKITHLVWEKEQALPFEMDLNVLEVKANIVPVTTGVEREAFFVIGADPEELSIADSIKAKMQRAIMRQGHDGTEAYLYSLASAEKNQLVWLGEDPRKAGPEVYLSEVRFESAEETPSVIIPWKWTSSLLGRYSAHKQDRTYTLENGTWKRVVSYQREGKQITHEDYVTDKGFTIRFGDGEFGMVPSEKTIFKVNYRIGGGEQSNVAAHTLVHFDSANPELAYIDSITNPLPAINGIDPESTEDIRQLAPEAFQAITYRAVRPEDYGEAAERLPWVQAANGAFRWTGSWLSAFVTADPRNAVSRSLRQERQLQNQLDRFRQAGREAIIQEPCYADLDVNIIICVEPFAFRGEVKEQVLEALLGKGGVRPKAGYFSSGNFTFGTPLVRSALEATIQSVAGVRAVEKIIYQRRGWFGWRNLDELSYDPGKNWIIRVENDPRHPERGTLKLKMKGGA